MNRQHPKERDFWDFGGRGVIISQREGMMGRAKGKLKMLVGSLPVKAVL
jgi:hypothetical protein